MELIRRNWGWMGGPLKAEVLLAPFQSAAPNGTEGIVKGIGGLFLHFRWRSFSAFLALGVGGWMHVGNGRVKDGSS